MRPGDAELNRFAARSHRNLVGTSTASLYDVVRATVQDRRCTVDVWEVPDTVPVLIGQGPLELLDFVIDPLQGRLVGNPAHGGEHGFEVY